MTQTPVSSSAEARRAELLARQISAAFTNACGYGNEHPMTQRACQTALGALNEALKESGDVTLLVDRGMLLIEKHRVGERFNPRRMISAFSGIGLESITFHAGVSENDLRILMAILADPEGYSSAEAASTALKGHNIRNIRLNHVVYRKLTSDQLVVDTGEASAMGLEESGQAQSPGGTLDSLLSLSQLVNQPEAAVGQISASTSAEDVQSRQHLVSHLRSLVEQVESGGLGEIANLPAEQLLAAMNTLRQQLRMSVTTRRDTDLIYSEQREAVSEIDQLTYNTLVALVREEFRGGNFSHRRMAQIINRMLPDPDDLKRLLPQLKRGLLEDGMSLADYGQLIHELSSEMRDDALVRALEKGADSVGLDVDDIISQIKEDPGEAARLVVLAAELRQGGAGQEDQLSAAFTDYIERISQKMAISPASTSNMGPKTLRLQLARVQRQLVQQINEKGLDPEAAERVNQRIEEQIEQSIGEVKTRLLDRILSRAAGLPTHQLADWLETQIEQPTELQRLVEPIRQLMTDKGYSTEQIAELLEELKERLEDDERPPVLSSRVLTCANTAMFLKREIKSAQRYKNEFSVVKILVETLVPEDGPARRPSRREIKMILPGLYDLLIEQARDLDLVGSLEKRQRAIPMLILPMTGQAGADIVAERIAGLLDEKRFDLSDGPVRVHATITAVGHLTEIGEDGNDFLARVNKLQMAARSAAG